MTELIQPIQLSSEDLLYNAMDTMSKNDLEVLRKDIDEEIELRKYKESRVKKMKQDLAIEQNKLLNKFKMDLQKQKMDVADYSDSDEDEIIEIKPKQKRAPPKKKK